MPSITIPANSLPSAYYGDNGTFAVFDLSVIPPGKTLVAAHLHQVGTYAGASNRLADLYWSLDGFANSLNTHPSTVLWTAPSGSYNTDANTPTGVYVGTATTPQLNRLIAHYTGATSASCELMVQYNSPTNPDLSNAVYFTDSVCELVINYNEPTCTYAIDPTSADYPAAGGSGMFLVETNIGCAWTVASNDPAWLHVTSSPSGIDDGTVAYDVDPNLPPPTNPRIGTITAAGLTFTVTQDGEAGSGTGGVSQNFGYIFPHNAGHHAFMTISFPNGYEPGLNIYELYSGMDELQFITVRPRSGYLAKTVGFILVLTDTDGVELTAGTNCGSVDIWRFRIA